MLGTLAGLTITANAQVGIDLGRGEIHLSDATSVLTIGGSMDIGNPVGGPGAGAVTLTGAWIEGAGSIRVNPNRALMGTGTINLCGACRVDAGGVISPGLLTINDGFNQLSDGVLVIEVAGLSRVNSTCSR